ncbi:MAG: MaoC family dehydratase [Chromatiales bacterium]|nr:MaoC family dehydratase [Chromatiales bacterium]
MARRIVSSIEDIKVLEGQEVGVSDWLLVDQKRIDLFAEATDDHQWIHTDPERARAELPIGGTIAHGYLLVSLTPRMLEDFVEFRGVTRVINYGLNKVRFKNMVASGKRIRMRSVLLSCRQRAGGAQVILENTIEIEGETRPACISESIALYFFGD